MRILHVINGRARPNGANGVENVVFNLSRAQAEFGLDVAVLGLSRKTPLPIPGVESVTFPPVKFPMRSSRDASRYIQATQPTLVHFHSVFTPSNTMLSHAVKNLGIPYIVTPHGALDANSMSKRAALKKVYLLLLENRFLRDARKIHTIARQERMDLNRLGIDTRSFLIPNGVEIDTLRSAPDPLRIRARVPLITGKRVFLFVGRLSVRHKGLDLLIGAIGQRRSELENCVFVIAGPGSGGVMADLKRLVQEYRVNDLVCFPGPFFEQDKLDLLATADVFVHTSRWEGMPMGVLEAMACGLPCLVTTSTNIGDLVSEAGAGCVTTIDTGDIAEGLVQMARLDSNELMEAGARARSTMLRDYTWKTIAAKMSVEYERSARA